MELSHQITYMKEVGYLEWVGSIELIPSRIRLPYPALLASKASQEKISHPACSRLSHIDTRPIAVSLPDVINEISSRPLPQPPTSIFNLVLRLFVLAFDPFQEGCYLLSLCIFFISTTSILSHRPDINWQLHILAPHTPAA